MKSQLVATTPAFQIGAKAPDATLLTLDNQQVTLSSFWQARPAILVFIRHFGCPHCRRQLGRFNQAHQSVLDLGGQIVAICMGELARSQQFAHITNLRYPLLSDPQEVVYDQYGLILGEKTFKWKLDALSKDAPAAASMLYKKEYGEFLLGGNKFRMGGTFIVDTAGTARYTHRDTDSTDGAPVDEVIAALHTLVSQ